MPPGPEEDVAAAAASSSASFRLPESARVFDELPRARIVAVSRPDAGDITPMLLSYNIEVQYKQVRPPQAPPPLLRIPLAARECVSAACSGLGSSVTIWHLALCLIAATASD
jgi:hypothetical protein